MRRNDHAKTFITDDAKKIIEQQRGLKIGFKKSNVGSEMKFIFLNNFRV